MNYSLCLKNALAIVLFMFTVHCCSLNNNTEKSSYPKTLFITSSCGAFNDEKNTTLQPENAYVIIDSVSSGLISMSICYFWHNDQSGFFADIPVVGITGSNDDFSISAKGIAARCKTIWRSENKEFQNITFDVTGHYKQSSEDVALNIIVTPSDNTIFPYLEILEVSADNKQNEEWRAETEWPLSKLVFNNQMDIPVIIRWDAISDAQDESLTLKANALTSKWCLYYTYPNEFPVATLIIDKHEFEINLFAEERYSMEQRSQYDIDDVGGLDKHSFFNYTFNIVPELFQ